MFIATSPTLEDILASPLVLVGISDECSEALKNLFRTLAHGKWRRGL